MKKIATLITILVTSICFSQRETDNWYFGDKASIHFNKGKIEIKEDGAMFAQKGCASISNDLGELLFYTNGQTVWNKSHQIMENGEDLIGEPDLSQPTIIIPKPNSKAVYYIFTTRKIKNDSPILHSGIYYSEVEISGSYPLGKIVKKNRRLANSNAERITAIHHKNGKDIWVLTYGSKTNNGANNIFMAFKVTEKGVSNQTVKSTLNELEFYNTASFGEMKVSPDASKIVISTGSKLYFYDFDNSSGNFTYVKTVNLMVDFTSGYNCNGLTFSPNSKFLYFSSFFSGYPSHYYIIQYDITNSSIFYLGDPVFTSAPNRTSASSQIGSDGKIYVAQINSDKSPTNSLGVINEPDKPGQASDYRHDAINLKSGLSYYGLPNFIQSYFRNRIIVDNDCVYNALNFSLDSYKAIASAEWNFGDGTTSNSLTPSHKFNTPGKHIVSCKVMFNDGETTFFYKEIIAFAPPNLIANQQLNQCDDNNDGVSLFNLNNINNKITTEADITFQFFRKKTDAENNINEISNAENFYNESNPQTIFAKATNKHGCSSIENFTIETKFIPPTPIAPITVCEDSDNELNDGKGDFDLRQKRDEIITNLSLTTKDKVEFYPTKEDAQKSTNKLPNRYTSASSTIWVKIENNLGCSGISPINLIVNHPIINLQDEYVICFNSSVNPPVSLTADSTNDRFEWRDQNNIILSTNNTFTLTSEGQYTLTVYKTENGLTCSNTKSFSVNYPPAPDIFSVEVNAENETENTVNINVNGGSNYEFSLDNNTFVGNGTSHTFYNLPPGFSTIYVRDVNQCETPTEAIASVIGYPKHLTPNADGFNDYWKVYGASTTFFKEINIKIFNRFGKVLFVINNNNAEVGWDGTFNGTLVPSNDYWFHAKLIDFNDKILEQKGHFSVISK